MGENAAAAAEVNVKVEPSSDGAKDGEGEEKEDVAMADEEKSSEAAAADKDSVEKEDAAKLKVEEKDPKKSGGGKPRRSRAGSSVESIAEKSLLDALDLNDLVKKNNGNDVDLVFYFKGKLLPSNTCFYEIY